MNRNVSDAAQHTIVKILHIRPDSFSQRQTGNWDTRLAATPLDVEACGDVYRGLARLGRSTPGEFRAVLVSLHCVGELEMEFFTIASRVDPAVPVFVYSDDRSRRRLERAIERGAAGPATDELLTSLAQETAATEASSDPVSPDPVSPAPPRVTRSPAASPSEEGGLHAVDDDELIAHARVPWRRHRTASTRVRPPGERPTDTPAERSPAASRSLDEPLLTEAELEALLGDDIAAIAPQPRQTETTREAPDRGVTE